MGHEYFKHAFESDIDRDIRLKCLVFAKNCSSGRFLYESLSVRIKVIINQWNVVQRNKF